MASAAAVPAGSHASVPLIATGSRDKSIKLFRGDNGAVVRSITTHSHYVYNLAFSPDGKSLASASDDNTCAVFDVASGQLITHFKRHTNKCKCVAWRADGQQLVSSSEGADPRNNLLVWHVSGRLVHTLQGHDGQVWCCAFSPDSKWIVSGSKDKAMILWDANSGTKQRSFSFHDKVLSCAWHPNSLQVLGGDNSGRLVLWNVSGSKSKEWQQGDSIRGCSFNHDGTKVSSSGDDSKLIVWQVAGSNTSALRTFSHRDWCRRGIFSLDGSTILSCCDDKKLRVFSLSSSASEPVKTFNTHHADWLLCADWYPRAGSNSVAGASTRGGDGKPALVRAATAGYTTAATAARSASAPTALVEENAALRRSIADLRANTLRSMEELRESQAAREASTHQAEMLQRETMLLHEEINALREALAHTEAQAQAAAASSAAAAAAATTAAAPSGDAERIKAALQRARRAEAAAAHAWSLQMLVLRDAPDLGGFADKPARRSLGPSWLPTAVTVPSGYVGTRSTTQMLPEDAWEALESSTNLILLGDREPLDAARQDRRGRIRPTNVDKDGLMQNQAVVTFKVAAPALFQAGPSSDAQSASTNTPTAATATAATAAAAAAAATATPVAVSQDGKPAPPPPPSPATPASATGSAAADATDISADCVTNGPFYQLKGLVQARPDARGSMLQLAQAADADILTILPPHPSIPPLVHYFEGTGLLLRPWVAESHLKSFAVTKTRYLMTPFYEHTLAQRFQSASAAKEMPTQREVLLLLLQLSMGLDHLRKNRVVARNMTLDNIALDDAGCTVFHDFSLALSDFGKRRVFFARRALPFTDVRQLGHGPLAATSPEVQAAFNDGPDFEADEEQTLWQVLHLNDTWAVGRSLLHALLECAKACGETITPLPASSVTAYARSDIATQPLRAFYSVELLDTLAAMMAFDTKDRLKPGAIVKRCQVMLWSQCGAGVGVGNLHRNVGQVDLDKNIMGQSRRAEQHLSATIATVGTLVQPSVAPTPGSNNNAAAGAGAGAGAGSGAGAGAAAAAATATASPPTAATELAGDATAAAGAVSSAVATMLWLHFLHACRSQPDARRQAVLASKRVAPRASHEMEPVD